ncbi:MAG: hypothetical protein NTX25_09230 [Proteobacteria bacterium]|nr:hypothetical protein [Pseudomonadota bacterium]
MTARTEEIGPPNSQSTWSSIANTIVYVIGYAIPINRLATMLKASNPYFTSSMDPGGRKSKLHHRFQLSKVLSARWTVTAISMTRFTARAR